MRSREYSTKECVKLVDIAVLNVLIYWCWASFSIAAGYLHGIQAIYMRTPGSEINVVRPSAYKVVRWRPKALDPLETENTKRRNFSSITATNKCRNENSQIGQR